MNRTPFCFQSRPKILSSSSVVGALEKKGPLSSYFDLFSPDSKFEMDSWEKAEAEMVRRSAEVAIKKAGLQNENMDLVFAGDLSNQCAATAFGWKKEKIPYIGLYGACSTFALSLGMAALSVECKLAKNAIACASSHYSTAERQYRFPLEYGCQRTPTSQTTVTGAGCAVLGESTARDFPFVSEFLPGIMSDFGIKDANNMGAAMAPACADTLVRYLSESGKTANDFDGIFTGDLGFEGHQIFLELCQKGGHDLRKMSEDCGKLIYDRESQEVNSGGSGCGCSATVFSGYIMDLLKTKKLRNILLIGTGALLSATTVLQKETIPAIAHLVRIEMED